MFDVFRLMRFVAVLACLAALTACIEKPDITIRDIRIEGIAEGSIKLKVLVDITNTNSYSVVLKKIEYTMFKDAVPFGNGVWEGSETLEAKAVKTFPMAIKADGETVSKMLMAYISGRKNESFSKLTVEGRAVVRKFGMNSTFHFKWKYADRGKDDKLKPQDGQHHPEAL